MEKTNVQRIYIERCLMLLTSIISLLKHNVDLNGRIHCSRRSFVITRYQRSFLNEGNNTEHLRKDDEKLNKMGLFSVHKECMLKLTMQMIYYIFLILEQLRKDQDSIDSIVVKTIERVKL